MCKRLLAYLGFLAMLCSLSGCLAISAGLGALSFLGPPAVQLAGVAYTVSEYSYEYAAHDRTPDQVLMAKFDWLVPAEEQAPAHRKQYRNVAMATPLVHVPALLQSDRPDLEPLFELSRSHPVMEAGHTIVPERIETVVVRQPKRIEARPAPVTQKRPEVVAAVAVAPETGPVHDYIYRTPDPIQIRMNRMESALRQAEAVFASQPANGVRLSMPCPDGDPCHQGLNGSWSIRHPVMYAPPSTLQPSASASRSLNT